MSSKTERSKENKRRKWIKLIIVLTVILILLLLYSLRFCTQQDGDDQPLIPDRLPDGTDPNAESIPGDTGSGPDSSGSGGSVSLRYSDQVSIDLSDNTAFLYFANPSRSDHDLILQIIVQDEVIAQSGCIPAGHKVETLPLLTASASRLREGWYSGKFVLYYYDQQTGEKAAVNTEIPIQIIVTN